MVSIYGLFAEDQCLYVGRTRKPETREASHRARFAGILGTEPEFRVLHQVGDEAASAAERDTIQHYRKLGQAKYNKYGTGEPQPPREPARVEEATGSECPFTVRLSKGIRGEVRRLALDLDYSEGQLMNKAVEAIIQMIEAPTPSIPVIVAVARLLRANRLTFASSSHDVARHYAFTAQDPQSSLPL